MSEVRKISVPADVRALTTLSSVDYEEAFVVDIAPVDRLHTGEDWARVGLS